MTALTVSWLFYFPYDEALLYRAVPPKAQWISEHDHLSDRWSDMSRNPVLLGALSGMDVSPTDVQDFMAHSPWRNITRLLGGKRAVVCYTERLGAGGKPAWVIASWVGGPIQLVRWGIVPKLIPGMSRTDIGNQQKAWMLRLDGPKSHLKRKLVVTAQDGMLIGVISENPMAIRGVLSCMNDEPPDTERVWRPAFPFENQSYTDRAWIHGARVDDFGYLPDMTMSCRSADGGNAVTGEVRIPVADTSLLHPITPEIAAGLGRLLGTAPDAFVCGPVSLLAGIPATPSNVWTGVRDVIQQAAPKADTVCVALMAEEFSGRIHGIKIRSLLLGVPVGDSVGVDDIVNPLIDHLNASYKLGMIAERAGSNDVRMLDCSQQPLVAGLDHKDKPACAVVDGWFYLASNLSALESLLRAPAQKSDPAEMAHMAAGMYASCDLEATYGAIRNVLSIYLLSQMFDNSAKAKDQQTRKIYDAMNHWSLVVSSLKQAELWMEPPDGHTLKIGLRIGPNAGTR